MTLCYISLLHLAFATPSNLDSSGTNPATASAIPKQMLQTMPLPPFAWGGKKGAVSPPALCSARQHLEPSALTAGQRGAGLMGTGHGQLRAARIPRAPTNTTLSSLGSYLLPLPPCLPAALQVLLLRPHGQVAKAPRMPHPHALQPRHRVGLGRQQAGGRGHPQGPSRSASP